MKKKKYLDLYYRWMKSGQLPKGGLCRSLGEYQYGNDLWDLFNDGCMNGYWGYWAEFYKEPVFTQDVDRELAQKLIYRFNPLRQNIVLLMAAMNNEL